MQYSSDPYLIVLIAYFTVLSTTRANVALTLQPYFKSHVRSIGCSCE